MPCLGRATFIILLVILLFHEIAGSAEVQSPTAAIVVSQSIRPYLMAAEGLKDELALNTKAEIEEFDLSKFKGRGRDAIEKDLVKQALETTNNNQTAAARLLGLTRSKFKVLMRRLENEGYNLASHLVSKNTRSLIAAVFFLLIFNGLCFHRAQGEEPADTMLMFVGEDLEALSIASRKEESAWQVPAIADMITRLELRERGIGTVSDALAMLPGFHMAKKE